MADIEVGSVDASQVLTSTIWPTGSHVRLLNVPWDSVYRDVVAWESAEARDKWFAAQSGSWFASNFQNLRPGEPIDVPVPYSSVYQYNYIVITNPQQPVEYEGPERSYFYFITNAQYLSPQATRLTVQLDVMTTYAGAIEYGRSYVESGHIAMANENVRGELSGQKLNDYMALPEGVDVGSELVPCKREYYGLISEKWTIEIIIISTATLEVSPGSIDKPNLQTATGQIVDNLPSGCNVYALSSDAFTKFMKTASAYSWVSQCIVAIYTFPLKLVSDEGSSVTLFPGTSASVNARKLDSHHSNKYSASSEPEYTTANVFESIASGLGSDSDLVKLYTYPYSVIELSCFNGNPIYLKPQLVRGNKVAFGAMCCALMPFAKAGLFPINYGEQGTGSQLDYTYATTAKPESGSPLQSGRITAGDFIDTCVWLTDFPQFSIVNNAYLTVLASSANTRAYQYSQAGWTWTKGNLQAGTAYTNATAWANTRQQAGQATADQQAANAQADYTTAMSNNTRSLVGGIASAALSAVDIDLANPTKGMVSAGQSLISTTNAYMANSATAATQNANAQAMAATSSANAALYGQTGRNAAQLDYNTALASNQGDYKQAVAAINASVQDAALTPPSTVGQMGGQGYAWSCGLVGVCITYKTITGSAKSAVADYFRRYGYSVKRYMQLGTLRHMLCMSKFAYWRVIEASIVCGKANETEREAMRGIAEKGFTLWDRPEDIGKTAVTDNTPRDGYSY